MGNELCLHVAVSGQSGMAFPTTKQIVEQWGRSELRPKSELAAFLSRLYTQCNINSSIDRNTLKELSAFCDLSGKGQLHVNEFLRLYNQLRHGFQQELIIGSRVSVRRAPCMVRYIGKIADETGEWIGVEFSGPYGDCAGDKHGVTYFNCNPNHGLFVRRGFVFPLPTRRPKVHDVVLIRNKLGTVRYVGETVLERGEMVGVELETADGDYDSNKYFKCQPGHGVFVRPEAVHLWNHMFRSEKLLRMAGDNDIVGARAMLQKPGIVIDDESADGVTALIVATAAGHHAMMKELLQHGANPNYMSIAGRLPLITAAQFEDIEAMEILIAAGADVNKASRKGGATALHVACKAGSVESVKCLVQHNADMLIKNSMGLTAYEVGMIAGKTDVIALVSPPPHVPIKIHITTLATDAHDTQRQVTIDLEVCGNNTVSHIKKVLEHSLGLSSSKMDLVHDSMRMENDQTLVHYGLRPGAHLVLTRARRKSQPVTAAAHPSKLLHSQTVPYISVSRSMSAARSPTSPRSPTSVTPGQKSLSPHSLSPLAQPQFVSVSSTPQHPSGHDAASTNPRDLEAMLTGALARISVITADSANDLDEHISAVATEVDDQESEIIVLSHDDDNDDIEHHSPEHEEEQQQQHTPEQRDSDEDERREEEQPTSPKSPVQQSSVTAASSMFETATVSPQPSTPAETPAPAASKDYQVLMRARSLVTAQRTTTQAAIVTQSPPKVDRPPRKLLATVSYGPTTTPPRNTP